LPIEDVLYEPKRNNLLKNLTGFVGLMVEAYNMLEFSESEDPVEKT
jgi:hypothetical protein